MITVLVPYLNTEKYIEETLDSLVAQTYKDFEIVCIDNCSTDKSREIVERYSRTHKNIKSIEFLHKGKSLALNYAINQCSSKWLAICDADDTWLPTKLEKQVSYLSSNSVDVIGTQMFYIDEKSNIKQSTVDLPTDHQSMVSDITLKKTNSVCNSSALYRKSLHTELVGFYNPLIFAVEDYDFWSRCAIAGAKFANINERLVCHRLHEQSSFNASNKQDYHKILVDGWVQTLLQIYQKVGE